MFWKRVPGRWTSIRKGSSSAAGWRHCDLNDL